MTLNKVWRALVFVAACSAVMAGQSSRSESVPVDKFNQELTDFVGQQLEAHIADIKTLNPPPKRVMNALTTGEFSWGAFMRSLASYSVISGKRELAGRDLPKFIGQIGLIESRQGGKTFAQLYGAIALISFGADLRTNPVWQSLTPD